MRRFVTLSQRRDIDLLLRRGARQDNGLFLVRSLPAHGKVWRVVMITPKKVFRHAVDRNRVTRRCRAFLDQYLVDQPPRDIAFLPRPAALTASWEEFSAALRALLDAAA